MGIGRAPSVRRGTERSQRQGSTSGAVVNGRPMLLVLIQVRAALAHLGLLGGALNLGPVVEVRFERRERGSTADNIALSRQKQAD